jgi:hypothetical protein
LDLLLEQLLNRGTARRVIVLTVGRGGPAPDADQHEAADQEAEGQSNFHDYGISFASRFIDNGMQQLMPSHEALDHRATGSLQRI